MKDPAMPRKPRPHRNFFCTACGDELTNFAFDPRVHDVKKLVQGFGECRESGKLAGMYCSKIFIAGGEGFHAPRIKKKASAKKVTSLKNSILNKIAEDNGKILRLPQRKRAR
jgi:hypothetical protein